MRTSKAVRLVAVFTLPMLLIFLAACGDDETPSDPGGTEDQGSSDVASDITPGDVDAGEGDTVTEDQADTGVDVVDEEALVDPCEGTISCMDPEVRRPRTSICYDNDFPRGSTCEVVPGGGEACCHLPFACETDADCEAERAEADFCPDEAYACVCNTGDGSCFTFVCFADAECAGDLVCRDGICSEAGSTDGLVARIVTASGPITEGETQQLVAVAVDPDDDARVFSDIAITWSSDATQFVDVDASGVATGDTNTGVATITARVTDNGSDTGDTIELYNYGDHDNDLRVIVFDDNSRAPVDGATVIIEESDGSSLEGTDAAGEITVDDVTFPLTVHVVHQDYDYVSYVLASATDDLLVSIAPTTYVEIRDQQDDRVSEDAICETIEEETLCYELEGVAAVVGVPDYSNITKPGEVDVALTGFEMGNDLLDLGFEIVVGQNISRDLSEGPIPIDDLSDIPAGVTLAGLGEPMIKTYVLTTPPAERIVWTLGGRVSLAEDPDLLPELIEQFDGEADIGRIVAIVLPVFKDFYVGVTTDYTVEMADEGLPLNRFDNPFRIPMRRGVTMDAPTIPLSETRPLETGMFIAGAVVPGHGFVPLGVTAAVDNQNDTPLDGVLDGDTNTDEIEPISLNVGPMQGTMNAPGAYFAIVSVALGLATPPEGNPERDNGVAMIHRFAPGELPPATVDLGHETFLELANGSTWSEETRTLTIDPLEGDTGVDMYRVTFDADRGRSWSVYFPTSVTQLVLPDLTDFDASFEDRTNARQIAVVCIDLQGGDDALTYGDVLPPSWPTSLDLIEVIDQFSRLEIKN